MISVIRIYSSRDNESFMYLVSVLQGTEDLEVIERELLLPKNSQLRKGRK